MPKKILEKHAEIIISHPGTDFDSLASMWAAHLLHPERPVVMIAGEDTNVREFLALYSGEFPRLRLKQLDISGIKHITIVDCSSRSQLGWIDGLLDRPDVFIEMWDHHRDKISEFRVDELHSARVGANVTLLVGELIRSGIKPSPEEATLLLLGIYEDTGGLRFPSTTPDDLDASSWLLKAGASLDMVDKFLGIRLSPAQKALLSDFSLNVQVVEVRGISIHITQGTTTGFVDEIAFLAKKVQETENADVIFALVQIDHRVFIVGRSRLPAVNVGSILSNFGGGGHPQAASCLLMNTDRSIALQRLLDTVRQEVRPTILARDIMTTSVRTIEPESSIITAHTIIALTGYSGLVVTDNENHVVGVITRSDIDKALEHNLGHAPVKGYMVRDPVTVTENTSLGELQNIIIEQRAGFLPVIFGGKVSGIVTRSDVLKALHRRTSEFLANDHNSDKESPREIGQKLLAKLPESHAKLLAIAGELADAMEVACFLVGGIVRDLVLSRKNVDIDLLIEGDGIEFARQLADKLDGRVVENSRFRTAKLLLRDGVVIDIATAREEFYIHPGALPEVAAAGIRDDLIRRDFTINTLAIQLNTRYWGVLVDHFGGLADIRNGLIRILHTFSFVDDPTRLLRALRFSERFGFRLETNAAELFRRALREGRLDEVSPERVRDELILCIDEENPWPILKRICDEGILGLLHPMIFLPGCLGGEDDPVRSSLEWMARYTGPDVIPDRELAYLAFLMSENTSTEAAAFVEKYHFDRNVKEIANSLDKLDEVRNLIVKPMERPSKLAWAIENIPSPLWVVLIAGKPDDSIEKINMAYFLEHILPVKPEIDGNDLIAEGFEPGPMFSIALDEVRRAKLDGEISSREEELALARDIITGR